MSVKEIDPLIKIQAWLEAYSTVEAERHARLVAMIVSDHIRDFSRKLSKPVKRERIGGV